MFSNVKEKFFEFSHQNPEIGETKIRKVFCFSQRP